MSDEALRISAKALGSLAIPDSCPRCQWLKLHVKNMPWQIFPGIFASIDAYTKKVIHGHFDNHGSAPPLLDCIGELKGYINPPRHTDFKHLDLETNILLTGEADGIFIRNDDSKIIVDYKTARFTMNQEGLFPMYEAQLNGYALIAEEIGLAPVTGLALLYFEPRTQAEAAHDADNTHDQGFALNFDVNAHHMPVQPEIVHNLLRKARDLYDSPIPSSADGCKDCTALETIFTHGPPLQTA